MTKFCRNCGFFAQLGAILFVAFQGSLNVCGQSIDATIDLDLIPKKKVREFIVDQHINSLDSYAEIMPSWFIEDDIDSYKVHEKSFVVREKLINVWECYKKANPVQSWDGRILDFGLLISKKSNTFLYTTKGAFYEIDTGQVYFLNIKLLKGVFNVPVAFEIINVDPVQKIIEFSYIKGNVSQGKQTLQFVELDDNTTQIVHRSYFKSGSNFRDGIYPYFHKKIIKDFHRNMKRIMKSTFK